MDKFVEGEAITNDEIRAGIRKATIALKIFPVICGTAFKNKGVQTMLDAVVDYLPSPLDVPPVEGMDVDHPDKTLIRHASDDEPFSALVFKIMTDPYVGQLAFFRVYSGRLKTGESGLQRGQGPQGAHRPPAAHARQQARGDPGNPGRRHLRRGGPEDGFDGRHDLRRRITRSCSNRSISPRPVIQLAVEPKTKADQEKLGMAIQKLAQEDPTFRVNTDPETGQTILSGMGELHLEIIVDRMMREFGVGANVGKPQVAYRETIRKHAEAEGRHVKQTGGRGQYGHVKIRVEPLPSGDRLRVRERYRTAAACPRNTSTRPRPGSRKRWKAASWPASRCRT